MTLEQTAEHYLGQSLQRDGYDKAKVTVHREQQDLYAKFTEVPEGYGKPLEQLLKTGELAYAGAKLLNKDGKWQYNWSLFLPLGMALDNRKSVELLHFPPDYSLTQAQDYLESSTTNRWAGLLTENGIGAAQTPAFQTIIDIAPIAAPANAGSALEGVYSYFNAYQTQMVMQLTAGEGGQALPMAARYAAGLISSTGFPSMSSAWRRSARRLGSRWPCLAPITPATSGMPLTRKTITVTSRKPMLPVSRSWGRISAPPVGRRVWANNPIRTRARC